MPRNARRMNMRVNNKQTKKKPHNLCLRLDDLTIENILLEMWNFAFRIKILRVRMCAVVLYKMENAFLLYPSNNITECQPSISINKI